MSKKKKKEDPVIHFSLDGTLPEAKPHIIMKKRKKKKETTHRWNRSKIEGDACVCRVTAHMIPHCFLCLQYALFSNRVKRNGCDHQAKPCRSTRCQKEDKSRDEIMTAFEERIKIKKRESGMRTKGKT